MRQLFTILVGLTRPCISIHLLYFVIVKPIFRLLEYNCGVLPASPSERLFDAARLLLQLIGVWQIRHYSSRYDDRLRPQTWDNDGSTPQPSSNSTFEQLSRRLVFQTLNSLRAFVKDYKIIRPESHMCLFCFHLFIDTTQVCIYTFEIYYLRSLIVINL